MQKLSVIILIVFLALAVSCGKSGDSNMDKGTKPTENQQAEKTPDNKGTPGRPGQKPGAKSQDGKEIDVDKLDIPDRMKEAIKSGRIPKDQIPEILARYQGGGGPAIPVSVTPIQSKPELLPRPQRHRRARKESRDLLSSFRLCQEDR